VEDYGPGTKWVAPFLDASVPSGAWILIVDDDMGYDRHLLDHAAAWASAWGNVAVAFSGWTAAPLMAGRGYNMILQEQPSKVQWADVDIVEGYRGVLFRKQWLGAGDALEAWLQELWEYRFVDDVLLSGWLAMAGVERRVVRLVPEELGRVSRQRWQFYGEDKEKTSTQLHFTADFHVRNQQLCCVLRDMGVQWGSEPSGPGDGFPITITAC